MTKSSIKGLMVLMVVGLFVLSSGIVSAAKPIVIGSPLSMAYLYGWTAERGIKLAIEEINAKGGVNVGGTKRPFTVEPKQQLHPRTQSDRPSV